MKMRARQLLLFFLVSLVGCSDSEQDEETVDAAEVVEDTGQTDTSADSGADDIVAEEDTAEEIVEDTVEVVEEVGPAYPDSLFLSDQFLNISHRGGKRFAPEETMEAFTHAVSVGTDVLELDIHTTSDGVVVVMHDDTVDRTTSGTGSIKNMTFEELRQLDAGYHYTLDGGATFPYRGEGLVVPTLQEVLEAFPDMYFIIEIKQFHPAMIDEALQVLYDTEMEARVVVGSFYDSVLTDFREAEPRILTSYGVLEMMDLLQLTPETEAEYVRPAYIIQIPPKQGNTDLLTPELRALVDRLGLKTHVWTINDRAEMEHLMTLGIDGIMTDDPELLEEVINASEE